MISMSSPSLEKDRERGRGVALRIHGKAKKRVFGDSGEPFGSESERESDENKNESVVDGQGQ